MWCKEKDCFNCKYDWCINVGQHKVVTPDQAKKYYERRKQLKEERYERGLCVRCGLRNHLPGFRTCYECKERNRRQKMQRDRQNGAVLRDLMDGVDLCTMCGRETPVQGFKLCRECLAKVRLNLDKTESHKSHKVKGNNLV